MGESKPDILQGTLDLMALKTLESMGPMHGYAIAAARPDQGRVGYFGIESPRSLRHAYPHRRERYRRGNPQWERVAATMALFLAGPK